MRRTLRFLSLGVVMLCSAETAFALPFTLSGVMTRAPQDGPAQVLQLTGLMNISDAPSVVFDEDDNRFNLSYQLSFTFQLGDVETFTGSGFMVINRPGCGLFDCNMVTFGSNGLNDYRFDVADGTFFYADGTAYPPLPGGDNSAYLIPPASFTLSHWTSLWIGGPQETANRYYNGQMTATRTESVPEPSMLALMGLGIGVMGLRSRRKSA